MSYYKIVITHLIYKKAFMKGYFNNKLIKLGINKNSRSIKARKNTNSLIYNKTTVPQIVHYYYYSGKQKVSNEETIIPIYFTRLKNFVDLILKLEKSFKKNMGVQNTHFMMLLKRCNTIIRKI